MKKVMLALMSLIVFSSFTNHEGYHIGDSAIDFNLKNIDGKMVSLSSIEAKGYVVVFTCNHCPFAKKYEDRLVKLNKLTSKKGYPLVAINPNDA